MFVYKTRFYQNEETNLLVVTSLMSKLLLELINLLFGIPSV